MIGRRFVWMLSALLTFAATGALAETLSVRAGVHPGFTRLVLEFSTRPAWRAGRTDAGYALGFDGAGPVVADLSQVFRRIGRDRIAAIEVEPDFRVLNISLACACAAEIYDYGENAIIVDIRPGQPGSKALHEAPFAPVLPVVGPPLATILQPRSPAISGDAGDVGDVIRATSTARPRRVNVRLPAVEALRNAQDVAISQQGSGYALPSQAGKFATPTDQALETSSTVSSAAVAAVAKQLSRAAIQGLVDPAEAAAARGENGTALPEVQAGPTNFRALTSVDRDTLAAGNFSESTRLGASCISNRRVRLADWGDPVGLSELGKIRHAAIAEDGDPTDRGRLDLARYYIVLGFGSEARLVAKDIPPGTNRKIIFALAEIIDTGKSSSTILDGQLACSGEIALWAALARPFSAGDLPQSPDNILAAFSALPRHLREQLGPVLSERLRAAGQNARARIALNAVTRAGQGSVQQELTAARLGLTGTAAAGARTELERISRGTDFTSAEALLELLLDAERRGVAPEPAWVDDAPSLIRVTDGTEIADRLSVAALLGHIPLERFDELRLALIDDLPGLTGEVRTRIAVRALAAAVGVESDAIFLRAELGFSRHAKPGDIEAETRTLIATRLLSMGLAELAGTYLPENPGSRTAAALAARILGATGRLQAAMNVAPVGTTPEYAGIRAELLENAGRLTDASREYLAAENESGAVRTALRSGDWRWIATQEDAPLAGAFQNILATRPDGSRAVDPSRNATLIDELTNRRAAYDQLLVSATIGAGN